MFTNQASYVFQGLYKNTLMFFTNEHLEQFSSVRIWILKCLIQIRQSISSKLE